MATMIAALASFALTVLGSAAILIGVMEPNQLSGQPLGGPELGVIAGPSQIASGLVA